MEGIDKMAKTTGKLHRRILRTVAGESGATFIEYALLAGLVGIIVAIAVATFSGKMKEFFGNITTKTDDASKAVQSADIKPK